MILSVKINLLFDRILLYKIHNLSGKILTVKIYLYLTRSCHLRLRNTECSIYEVPGLRRRGSRDRGANREKWSTGKEGKMSNSLLISNGVIQPFFLMNELKIRRSVQINHIIYLTGSFQIIQYAL